MDAPACYDCLTGDVTVKVTGDLGFGHWFCAACWAAQQEFHERVMAMLGRAARALEQELPMAARMTAADEKLDHGAVQRHH